jgi:ribosomal protein S4E
MRLAVATLVLVLSSFAAYAETTAGRASIIVADTIQINGEVRR